MVQKPTKQVRTQREMKMGEDGRHDKDSIKTNKVPRIDSYTIRDRPGLDSSWCVALRCLDGVLFLGLSYFLGGFFPI